MLELLVQTNTGTSNLASTVVAFSNNTVAGNSIVVISGNSSSTSGDISGITDTQGNIYVKDITTANATVGEVEIWHTSGIIGGANTVTVAYTTGVACAVIIREYYGLIYSNSIDKTAGTTGNSNTLNSGNTTALTQTNELLIGAGLIPLANTFSASGGYVNLVSAGAPLVVAVAAADLFVTTGGAQSASFGANASIQWVCCVASFFLSPTGTTTSTSSTSISSTSTSSTSISSTSSSVSTSSTSTSTTTVSTSSTSSSISISITTMSTSSTSSSISSTSISSTSSSTSISSTSSSISSTSTSSTSTSSTSSSTSFSSTSSSFSSTSSSISSTSISISSTSISSTSSSSSTSSTTLPPPYLTYSYQDQAPVTTALQFNINSPSTWTCPTGVTSVLAECWGGGGGGGGSTTGHTDGGGGGGGGGYASTTVSVTPGTIYTVSVGGGGTAGASGSGTGGTGGTSFFNSSGTVNATGGSGGGGSNNAGTATVGSGGTGTGTVTHTGGNGGGSAAADNAGGGGGGAAGSLTNGGVGQTVTTLNTGGNGGTGGMGGGIGGQGAVSGAGRSGNSAGAGGGGAAAASSAGGPGGGGIVQLTYTSIGIPTTGSNLINAFNIANYSNASGDDGDYFVEYGSEYMIRNYKRKNTNNTDAPTMSWKGRTTESTLVSPMLIQIYNVNSAAWETLTTASNIPADTDFSVKVSQTTNISNYYDSSNIVTFRSYQQVV